MRRLCVLIASLFGLALLVAAAPAQAADPLQVGVGRADITSPTGYYMQGWVRSDAILQGVNTRIEARAIVLKRGGQKLALVSEDLNGIADGVVVAALDQLKSRGFDETNVIVSASHTHAAPSGYFTYPTYNTVFMTTSSTTSLTTQNIQGAIDPQLYAFEVRQLVLAITRADDDLGEGRLGWATVQLLGLTANRSLEAHLADFGIDEPYGQGKVSQDPGGYIDTIDPDVQVLRVDKKLSGTWRSVGLWTTFADHGTVNKYQWGVYNDDHHAAADRGVEAFLRKQGVPAGQDVVNAYGNTDEGDQSAGLTRSGPAAADYVGQVEAAAMIKAWKAAGAHLTTTPVLKTKWTRMCFCGQTTAQGATSKTAVPGLPLFTGSEEGRGPLYDITQMQYEGTAAPVDNPLDPTQGKKVIVPTGYVTPGSVPTTVPLTVAQVGERLVATIPGEMTVDMGRRVRGALMLLAKDQGITGIQLSGLANEYLSYFTTPQEYDAQHYEGGSTMYGRDSSVQLQEMLMVLETDLLQGKAAPVPDTTDPRNGQTDTAAPFGTGATSATAMTQPTTTQRLQRATFSWQGGVKGLDMPLGKAFVSVERIGHGTVADDQGLQMVWRVDDDGVYTAQWEAPRDAALGLHRFVITGNHYRLVSQPFLLTKATTLSVENGKVRYPDAVVNTDLTYRPAEVGGARIVKTTGTTVPAGDALDAYGNCNGAAASTTGARAGADATADPAVCAAAVAAPRPVQAPPTAPVKSLPTTGAPTWPILLGVLLLMGAVLVRRSAGRLLRHR